jgi:hypothetical protein
MPVEHIATKVPVSQAAAPAVEAPPAQATKSPEDNDRTEPSRPKADLCWPPPFHPALAGISQIRPICRSLQRFGGRDAK